MPSVNVLTDIIINRPAAAVSAYAADPSNAPAWYVNIESAEWKTPPPLRAGAQIGFTAHFLGRRLKYTYEIAETKISTVHEMARENAFPLRATIEPA